MGLNPHPVVLHSSVTAEQRNTMLPVCKVAIGECHVSINLCGFAETMIMGAPSPDIMNKMARSVLAMYSYDDKAEDTSLENIINQSINLVAQIPTMMIYAYQTKRHVYEHKTMYFHFPTPGQSTAEHILSTYRITQDFTHEEAKLLDLFISRVEDMRELPAQNWVVVMEQNDVNVLVNGKELVERQELAFAFTLIFGAQSGGKRVSTR